MIASPSDIAWAAGFFEGEGSFESQHPTVRLAIEQVDPEPLYRMQRLFGGQITLRRRGQTNATTRARPIYCWRSTKRSDVVAIMTVLSPWLSERRKAQWIEAVRRSVDPEARLRRLAYYKAWHQRNAARDPNYWQKRNALKVV